jgi:hypothetical protein
VTDDLLGRIDDVLNESDAVAAAYYDEVGDPWRGRVPTLEEMLEVVFPPGPRKRDSLLSYLAEWEGTHFTGLLNVPGIRAYAPADDEDAYELCGHGTPINRPCMACAVQRQIQRAMEAGYRR